MEELENLQISKQILNIIFVGHVDAGKSTLCGQILMLQNIVDSRTLEKYKESAKEFGRESWYLSWCMDTNPEEREKGKTTELGTAFFELKNKKINILDAPGHKQYVFEMISGANCADVGVLVVSARINEFEAGFEKGGQTREHIILMKSGTIQKLVVLVNKMDDPSVKWSEERFNEIKSKIGSFIKFLFKDTVFIPVSGLTGENIGISRLDWYKGPTFFDFLNFLQVEKKDTKFLNILIIEKLKSLGSNLVCGKIDGGIIKKDDITKVVPGNIKIQVLGIFNQEDVEIQEGVPGDTVKLKLSKIDEIQIGSRLVEVNDIFYKSTHIFTSRLTVLDCENIISTGFVCMLHINVMTVQCKILEIRSLEKKKMRFLRAGQKALVKIECEKEIVLCDREPKERFALRLGERTLGVGIIRYIL
ncbi:eukaryotic peptide chain release factor GTP-binding subunit (ERF3A) [Vairimorpha necatrix]|uniref:Eukaryotic peptide chain release factor GTP-binding subunit (ERF3A) n=1 Tax=Vairimorpha necatrix TaxID=6039 RepID=A0AAX4JBS7_9MICR